MEDVDMFGAQYITAEEMDAANEAQRQLELTHISGARPGIRLGEEIFD